MGVPRFLVVEDEIIFAWHLMGLINDMGYKVNEVVSSGENGLKAINEEPPDVILMDITLNGKLNGMETAKKIRLHANIPIIFITGHSDQQIMDWVSQVSKSIILKKPIETGKLIEAINTILANKFIPKLDSSC